MTALELANELDDLFGNPLGPKTNEKIILAIKVLKYGNDKIGEFTLEDLE